MRTYPDAGVCLTRLDLAIGIETNFPIVIRLRNECIAIQHEGYECITRFGARQFGSPSYVAVSIKTRNVALSRFRIGSPCEQDDAVAGVSNPESSANRNAPRIYPLSMRQNETKLRAGAGHQPKLAVPIWHKYPPYSLVNLPRPEGEVEALRNTMSAI